MGGGNGAKAATRRARNAKEAAGKEPKSQLKAVCTLFKRNFKLFADYFLVLSVVVFH